MCVASIVASHLASSQTILELDFGDTDQSSFGTSGNLSMDYLSVSAGINARMVIASELTTTSTGSGSVAGDARVTLNFNPSNPIVEAELELFLYDATVGNGFESLYNPGTDYEWALMFYDIDGWITVDRQFHDEVEIFNADSVIYTADTNLIVGNTGSSYTFSGEDAGAVPGQDGITQATFTEDQQNVSVQATLTNQSSVRFNYTVVSDGTFSNNRNLLIDGGTVSFTTETVPEPSSFMLGALAIAAGLLRRKR